MKRLLLLVMIGAICPELVASVAVVRNVVMPRSFSDPLLTLHMTDCQLPCWIGINPGRTTLNKAREQIKQTFGQSDFHSVMDEELRERGFKLIAPNIYEARMDRIGWRVRNDSPDRVYDLSTFDVFLSTSAALIVDIYSTKGIVKLVGFSIYPEYGVLPSFTPRLNDVIEAYGLPNCVDFYEGEAVDDLMIYYRNKKDGTYKTFVFNARFGINPPLFTFRSNDDTRCTDPSVLDIALLARFME